MFTQHLSLELETRSSQIHFHAQTENHIRNQKAEGKLPCWVAIPFEVKPSILEEDLLGHRLFY